MNTTPDTDSLTIINGPEDGVVFPIHRTPFNIGTSGDCAVFLNFDQNVMRVHALATVVSGGYRVRSISGAPVFINEKRSGMVWARIARSGDILRLGDTSLCLVCAPDGLASRSIGIPTESNVAWLIRFLVQQASRALVVLYWACFKILNRVNRTLLAVMAVVLFLACFKPGFVRYVLWFVWGWTRYFWSRIPGG